MNDIVMGNVNPLKKRIIELENEVTRLRKLLQDIQRPEIHREPDPYYDHYDWFS